MNVVASLRVVGRRAKQERGRGSSLIYIIAIWTNLKVLSSDFVPLEYMGVQVPRMLPWVKVPSPIVP